MPDITEVDKNLKVDTNLPEKDIIFYDTKKEPFNLYGFCGGEGYKRIPTEVAEKTNEGVLALHANTAGGRVRFKTDSPYIAISAEIPNNCRFSHMPATGVRGFDLYEIKGNKYTYIRTFIPPEESVEKYEGLLYTPGEGEREYVINFPLYNDVSSLYVGVKEGSSLNFGGKYINEKPVVYYGSSITQGGCASRPGRCYQAIISGKFNCDYINLGFSGSAKAEDAIAEYISNLDMCCFVYDYDHNAPSLEHLKNTHESMFKKIREKHPELPVIMISSPVDCWGGGTAEKRRSIVYNTYLNAKNNGDKNVYFIDGLSMFGDLAAECSVDRCHPTDLGFYFMAESISKVMEEAKIF